ncbi:MAG: hypothetical protein ACRDXX_10380 [Stackebrandtia sp.]
MKLLPSAPWRSLSAVGLAVCLGLAGCDGSKAEDPSDASEEGGQSDEPADALPEPGEPELSMTYNDYPVVVRPVGVEVSPTLMDAPPGQTYMGVMLEVRGEAADRPTPTAKIDWAAVYPKPTDDECPNLNESDDGSCFALNGLDSGFFPDDDARGQGLDLFQPLRIEEKADGEVDEMEHGVGYYVEYFFPIPETEDLSGVKLCDDPHDQTYCVDVEGLTSLPERE